MPRSAASDRMLGLLAKLRDCPPFPFSRWPDPSIPPFAAGVYTIWRGDQFIYAGMAGKGIDKVQGTGDMKRKRKGLADRLNAHFLGRRSGDQFCVYVCDRLILPSLDTHEIRLIAGGELSLDARVQDFVGRELQYRFVVTDSEQEARELENRVRRVSSAQARRS